MKIKDRFLFTNAWNLSKTNRFVFILFSFGFDPRYEIGFYIFNFGFHWRINWR